MEEAIDRDRPCEQNSFYGIILLSLKYQERSPFWPHVAKKLRSHAKFQTELLKFERDFKILKF